MVLILPFSLLFFVAFNGQSYSAEYFPNHAKLEPGHVQSAQNFVEKYFKSNGVFSKEKTQNFINRLNKEKQSILEDSYETSLIQSLEIKISDFEKAKKDAIDELNEKKNDLAVGINQYLIPQLELLIKKIEEGVPQEELEGIIAGFVQVYSSYYMPNIDRNFYPKDRPFIPNGKKAFTGFRFEKGKDLEQLQANNLSAKGYESAINECLSYPVDNHYPLTNEQINKLIQCGFDISRLNPVPNPFWEESNSKGKSFEQSELFPTPDDTVYFSEVRYSSLGSPKMTVFINRKGKKLKFKAKMGIEVHNEIASTSIARVLGFHQDQVEYRRQLKVYLPKEVTYDNFVKSWIRRYSGGISHIENWIVKKGEENGQVYVIFRDLLLEANDPSRIKLEVFDPDGWDLPNRREHRGVLAWYALANIWDTKPGNHRVNLVKTKKGLIPEFSLQDIGMSLGVSFSLNPNNIFKLAGSMENGLSVNAFNKSVMKWSEDDVTIYWNDFIVPTQKFKHATYADIKWMARKIAKLSMDDIRYALSISGMPKDVQDLYSLKLAFRRNQMVKAFDLENEFPLIAIPDIDTYTVLPNIKNGRIIVSNFEGDSHYEGAHEGIWARILTMIPLNFNVPGLVDQLALKVGGGLGGTIGQGVSIWDGKEGQNFSVTALKAGMRVTLDRKVEFSKDFVANGPGVTHAYATVDTVKIELYLGSNLIADVAKYLPVSVRGELQIWSKEFQMVQFADNWIEGYKVPFKLFSAIYDFSKYAQYGLKKQEVIKIQDSYGMSIGAGVNTPLVPLLSAGVSAGVAWRKSESLYYFRDALDDLHSYRGKNKQFSYDTLIAPLKLDLLVISFPIIGVDSINTQFHHSGEYYTFKIPSLTSERHHIKTAQEEREFYDFLENGPSSPFALIHRNLQLESKGQWLERNFTILGLLKKTKKEGEAQTIIRSTDGKERHFSRSYEISDWLTGLEAVPLPALDILTSGMFVIDRNMTGIDVEMDEENIQNTTAIVIVNDFDRKLERKEVLQKIDRLNNIFSQNKDLPFFRNYTLPDENEVKTYRKVQAQIRMYVNGGGIINIFSKLPQNEIGDRLRPLFLFDHPYWNPKLHSKRFLGWYRLKRPWKKMVSSMIDHQKTINKVLSQPKKLVSEIRKLLKDMLPAKHGSNVARQLIGDQHIFVMGEIFGIFPSFNHLQTFELIMARRFAGKSWGRYVVTPPIREYISKNLLAPISSYVSTGIDQGIISTNFPVPKPYIE